MTAIRYRTADVDGLHVFYREAGALQAPNLLLLHGFPSAGHMFRDLIPHLDDRFHIIAPDLPGFGKSDMPGRGHTFHGIAETIDRFTGSSASTAMRSTSSITARRLASAWP
jgi:pimeloyl-ACP methyl ester carboxylesterase